MSPARSWTGTWGLSGWGPMALSFVFSAWMWHILTGSVVGERRRGHCFAWLGSPDKGGAPEVGVSGGVGVTLCLQGVTARTKLSLFPVTDAVGVFGPVALLLGGLSLVS